MKKRLETLTRAHGVSGDESAIRAAIRQAAEPYADDITEDALGNLIVFKKGRRSDGPKLLLADEPTGALDSASGAAVMELFQQLHDSGSTIIMITHDQGIAQHAHTIMNIRDGVLSGGAFHE